MFSRANKTQLALARKFSNYNYLVFNEKNISRMADTKVRNNFQRRNANT